MSSKKKQLIQPIKIISQLGNVDYSSLSWEKRKRIKRELSYYLNHFQSLDCFELEKLEKQNIYNKTIGI